MKTIEEIAKEFTEKRNKTVFGLSDDEYYNLLGDEIHDHVQQQVSIAVEKYKDKISLLETQTWISAEHEEGYGLAIEHALSLAPQILEELKGGGKDAD